jgi:hypothetical protein
MPSLVDLCGDPPPGYEKVQAFVSNGRPRGWFVQQHNEFSPTLLILGTVYEIEASGERTAGSQAIGEFVRQLGSHGLPLPPNPVRAEPAN